MWEAEIVEFIAISSKKLPAVLLIAMVMPQTLAAGYTITQHKVL